MSYIAGVDREQAVLFPESLDEYIAEESVVRFLDAFVETLEMDRLGFERARPAATGRPGYDPRDLLRLYLYGYLHRVRSSRMLERECQRNVEVMWLLRKLRPDHKTIADFRRDHAGALKQTGREFVLLCKRLDLFGGELVAIDGSKFRASNAKQKSYTRAELEKLQRKADEKISAYLAELDRADQVEGRTEPEERLSAQELKAKIEALKSRKDEYTALLGGMEAGQSQISLTDAESRRMKVGSGTAVCYNVQIAVDSKHHLICAQEVTNQENDFHQLASMAEAAQEALQVDGLVVTADAGYHEEEELARCEAMQIETYVPRPQVVKTKGRDVYPKSAFTYEAEHDGYRCPAGALLSFRHEGKKQGKTLRYYRSAACATCPLRAKCTTEKQGRRIARTPLEHIVERAAERLKAKPQRRRERWCLAEHPFGSMKGWMGQGSFLLRGLRKVRGEFSLTVLSYNLRRAIRVLGVGPLLEAVRRGRPVLIGG
jgi:transposase